MSHYANGSGRPGDEHRVLRLRRCRRWPSGSACGRRSTGGGSPGRSRACSGWPGSCLILAGVFEVDRPLAPQTVQEVIHSNSAVAAFVLLIVAMLLFSLACWGDDRWWSVRRVSLGLAVARRRAPPSAPSWPRAPATRAPSSGCSPAPCWPGSCSPPSTSAVPRSVHRERRACGSRWVRAALSLAVVVLIFGFFFPKVADYGAVWDTIAAMTPLELGSLLAVAAWNIASYWPMLTAVQPGLRLREAAVANLSSTAVANTVPGGGALGVGVTMTMQRSWGIPVSRDGAGDGRVGRVEQLRQARPARSSRSPCWRMSGGAEHGARRRRRWSAWPSSPWPSGCSPCCCAASTWRPRVGAARRPAGLGRAAAVPPRPGRRAGTSGPCGSAPTSSGCSSGGGCGSRSRR